MEQLRNEIDRLRERVNAQAMEITRLEELSETDALTGIANRRSFEKELRRRYSEQQRDGRGFCLMIIDVDGFKGVNDELGHAEGDRLLQSIANVIESNVRASDIVFRIGGDELAIILPGVKLDQARIAAQRLIELTCSRMRNEIEQAGVGLSIGLVESNGQRPIDQLIEAADRAMYRAKKQGGSRYLTEDLE